MGSGKGKQRRTRTSAVAKPSSDEPTIDKYGTKEWRVDDKLHRVGGPAVERANGAKEWWVNGQHISEAEFGKKVSDLRREAAQAATVEEVMTNPEYRNPFGD